MVRYLISTYGYIMVRYLISSGLWSAALIRGWHLFLSEREKVRHLFEVLQIQDIILQNTSQKLEMNTFFNFSFKWIFFFKFSSSNQMEIIYGGLSDKFIMRAHIANTGERAYQANMKLNYSTDFKINSIVVPGVSLCYTLIFTFFLLRNLKISILRKLN